MWDVNQRQKPSHPPSLSQWLYSAIAEPDVRLRIRLRGNILHILCEGIRTPEQSTLMSRFVRAFESQIETTRWLLKRAKEPVYKIIVYGRAFGEQEAAWIEPILLDRLHLDATQKPSEGATSPSSVPLASNESLARMGSTEAVARFLSESFSHLGVSIKTLVQKLPEGTAPARGSEPAANKRLWVVCNCDYSPDASLLAEPIAQKLRDLELTGFRDAVIRAQVSGETTPEWILQVDLTHPEVMLHDWARWGDAEAIARLLDSALEPAGLQVQAILKDSTLHVFCSLRPSQPKDALERETAKNAIAPLLEEIAPQGITAATLYGVEGPKFSLDLPEQPIWVEWLNLPAAQKPDLAPFPWDLARQNRSDALTFILQRLLNPDLDTRLATGGLRVKLCCKDRLLYILTEGLICPAQTQVVPPIEDTLRQLLIPGIAGARIYGRRAGQSSPLWSYKVDFLVRSKTAARSQEDSAPFSALNASVESSLPPDAHVAIGAIQRPARAASENPLGQILEELRQNAARWLSSSKLFIAVEPTDSLSAALYREETSYRQAAYEGLKSIAVWGAVGVLLVVQVDWLLARTLKTNAPSTRIHSLAPSTSSARETALPEMSLQQTSPDSATGFNSQQFTDDRTDSNAATAAILAAARSSNPSFNNQLLDEKLALYLERIRTRGVPDVLVVGSSRAMRGIDPATLQQAIAKRSDRPLEVFNFGINGATARVVDLMLRQVLTPEQLPKLIIWADGARAFNSGRPDRTYEAIASSAGYQQLQAGTFPNTSNRSSDREAFSLQELSKRLGNIYQSVDRGLNDTLAGLSFTYSKREQLQDWLRLYPLSWLPGTSLTLETSAPQAELPNLREAIDLDGFLPLSVRFDPRTYYAEHPRVTGAYDSDYDSFNIEGDQYEALRNLTQFLNQHRVELVFVNLPLTNEYLDPVRRKHEQEFVARMQQVAIQDGLIFRDLAQRWPTEYALFSDPSHLNRYGADRVSLHLAQDPTIPWQQ